MNGFDSSNCLDGCTPPAVKLVVVVIVVVGRAMETTHRFSTSFPPPPERLALSGSLWGSQSGRQADMCVVRYHGGYIENWLLCAYQIQKCDSVQRHQRGSIIIFSGLESIASERESTKIMRRFCQKYTHLLRS